MSYDIIFNRKHALYASQESKWKRAEKAYSGGQEYITEALIQHVSEVNIEFQERKKRAHYFNYPRKVSGLISEYVFSKPAARNGADGDLVEDWSRSGQQTGEVMGKALTMLSVFGASWVLVDMPATEAEVVTLADKKAERLRPYAVAMSPLSVPDWCFGGDGRLLWAIVEQTVTDKSDPENEPEDIVYRWLWDRERWRKFKRSESNGAELVE